MPIEIDDESTQFDPRPWGAQQRLLPRGNFAAQRISGTLQETSIPQIPSLPDLPGMARMPSRMTTAPASMPVASPKRMPVGTPATAMPVAPIASSLAHGSTVAPLPVAPMHLEPEPVSMPMHAMPMMFSPSIAATMPVFNAPVDSTLRVHRAQWTARSFIAVPLGALAAILLIVIGYRVTSGPSPRAHGNLTLPAAAAVSAQPLTAPVLTPDTYVPPVADGVASFEPATAEPTLAPVIVEHVATPARKMSRKHAASSSSSRATSTAGKKRPRKIVAVDSSTPLGNLRVKRY